MNNNFQSPTQGQPLRNPAAVIRTDGYVELLRGRVPCPTCRGAGSIPKGTVNNWLNTRTQTYCKQLAEYSYLKVLQSMSFIYKDAVNKELDKLLLLYKMGSIPKDTVKKMGLTKLL